MYSADRKGQYAGRKSTREIIYSKLQHPWPTIEMSYAQCLFLNNYRPGRRPWALRIEMEWLAERSLAGDSAGQIGSSDATDRATELGYWIARRLINRYCNLSDRSPLGKKENHAQTAAALFQIIETHSQTPSHTNQYRMYFVVCTCKTN